MTPAQIAEAWLVAFNAYDVDALLRLYAEDATHTSPKIRALHPETDGKLLGKPATEAWWRGAIGRTPGLRYEKTALTTSSERAVLEYVRHADGQPPLPVAEIFDVKDGRVVASRVFHG